MLASATTAPAALTPALAPVWGVFFSTPLAALLAAGAAAAVPVVIHLLNRRRYQVVRWAAMRFLLAAQRKNVRRLRLEQWLLLALRVFVVLALVAAMASVAPWAEAFWQRVFPGGPAPPAGEGRAHRVLVLDGSFSMAAGPAGASRWDAALREAEAYLRGVPAGDGVSVVFLGGAAQALVPGPVDDPAPVIEEVRSLKLPHGGADVAGGLNLVAEILARSPDKYARREVCFFTDLQRSSWALPEPAAGDPPPDSPAAGPDPRSPSVARAWARVRSRARVVFVDAAGADLDNLAVTHLALNDPLPLAGARTSLTATVSNFSRAPRANLRVRFLVGAARGGEVAFRQVEERSVAVPAGGSTSVTFAHQFPAEGEYVARVALEPDALPLDDERSLVVRARAGVPVLLVNGHPDPRPQAEAAFWAAKALNPFPPGREDPRYPARPRVLSLAEFGDAALGDLARAEVVFLCDVPRFTGGEVERLESHLRRGGTVVIGLGPNAARNLDHYNRLLHDGGRGLLACRLAEVRAAEGDGTFTLAADEASFTRAPLEAFRADDDRAALMSARFRRYVRAEVPAGGAVRRVLSFVPERPPGAPAPAAAAEGLDPALLEWSRHRGRVILYASSFNTDWTSWPLSPSFAPFVQELFRHAVAGTRKPAVQVGEPLEEHLPVALAGLSARFRTPDGREVEAPVPLRDDAALLTLAETDRSGLYRADVGPGRHSALFAVNVPVAAALGGSESDLARVPREELLGASAAGVAVVEAVRDIPPPPEPEDPDAAAPPPPRAEHGRAVARVLLWAALVALLLEVVLAWRFGAARAGPTGGEGGDARPRRGLPFGFLAWAPPLLACAAILAALAHEAGTGRFLDFLPGSWRAGLERELEVPAAAAGEGTRWRLDRVPFLTGDPRADAWILAALAAAAAALVVLVYRQEARAVRPGAPRGRLLAHPLVPPAALRLGLVLLLLFVLLPQLRLQFEREGWPAVVLIFDDSRSMGKADDFTDPRVREKAEELAAWTGLSRPDRLSLAQALAAREGSDWLTRLVAERRVRLHVYHVSGRAELLAEAGDAGQAARAAERVRGLRPEGAASQLGDAVEGVLKSFRGGSLAAVVLFTDGITCFEPGSSGRPRRAGLDEDLPRAGRLAARAGVPLFFVGVGDSVRPYDLVLSDLQVEDVVQVNDRLVFEARLTAEGRPPGGESAAPVPVVLYEKQGEEWVERAREVVRPEGERPRRVRLLHAPEEKGEKVYRLEVPRQEGERQAENNRLERTVLVTEARRLRVLMLEGYPRYEFRFLKSLLERQAGRPGAGAAAKPVDLKVLQFDADKNAPLQDRTLIETFPTSEELMNDFDVVVLGDVDPKEFPNPEANLRLLADFVREKGGGLLMIAGPHAAPRLYRDTPLADVLPVAWDVGEPGAAPADPLVRGYRPRLSPVGQGHPVFRFAADDARSAAVWGGLEPMLWFATGYRRKLSAEVLAAHPERPAEGPPGGAGRDGRPENHPLALQQFAGAGRVLFFGFDETWRWRKGDGEGHYERFWLRCVRMLARSRLGRTELRLDRQVPYREGEPIRVTVRFPDDAPPPPPGAAVKVLVERYAPASPASPVPGERAPAEVQTLRLAKVEGTRAAYEALLTRTPVGDYRFRLAGPPGEGSAPSAEGRVLPMPGETDRLEMNRTGMEQAAAASGGRFFTLADAEGLIDALPEGRRVPLDQPREPWLLWNHPAVFLLVLGMFAVEWVLRKRHRLV